MLKNDHQEQRSVDLALSLILLLDGIYPGRGDS